MKNNFQSKAVPRGTRTIWRYLSALFLLLTFSIGQMWGANGDVLFSQDFNSAAASAYGYTSGSTTQTHDWKSDAPLTGLVGSSANLFTSIKSSVKKGDIAINSETGGNSVDATGIFRVYGNGDNAVQYSLVRTTNFAATAPTALKVTFDVKFKNMSSGSNAGVSFAIGSGFSEAGLSIESSANVHSGFSIIQGNTPYLSVYGSSTKFTGNPSISADKWISVVLVINNTGDKLTYANPTGSGTTDLNNDCFDIWYKETSAAATSYTKRVSNQAAVTAGKDLQNIYIGNAEKKKHELNLDNLVITDLTPAPAVNYTVTIDPNGGSYASTPDGWTYSTGVYTKEIAGGTSFTAPAGLTKGTDDLTWKDGSDNPITFPVSITGDITFVAQWAPHAASSDATLSALSVAGCTFNETFDPATFAYTVDLPFYASMPTTSAVTATKNDLHASDPVVSISGNVISVEVTPESGAADKKTYTITVTIAPAPTASSSINIEQAVLDNGKGYDIVSALTTANIVTDGRNGLDSLNDVGKTNRNYAYLGLKLKKANADIIKIVVPAEKALNVKFGNVGVALTTTINGVAGSNVAKKTDGNSSTFHLDAAAVVREVVFHSSENQTVTLQQVKIGADVDPITLPWLVTYDAGEHGTCATAKETWKGTALTLPAVTPESGWNFEGWNDDEDNPVSSPYTPTKNVTLTAQYTAQASPFDLTALTYKIGTGDAVNVGYEDGTFTYNIELPYKPSYDAITVAPTLKEASSSLKGDEVLTVTSLPGAATFTVVENGGANEQLYTVNFTKAPKDGICLIKGNVGNDTFVIDEEASLLSGTADKNNVRTESSTYDTKTGWKFNARPARLGITLSGAETFQAGDIVEVFVTTVANISGANDKMRIFDANEGTSAHLLVASEDDLVQGANRLVLPTTSTNSLYLHRTKDGDYDNFNPYVAYVAVYRAMNPVLTAITFDGVDADQDSEFAFSATLPQGTNLGTMTVTPTIVWNGAGSAAPTAAWAWGDNTYRVTDKDGDYTDYTITLTEALAPSADPVITAQPASANYYEGATIAALEVVATGSGDLSYQWYLGSDEIDGATAATYTPTVSAIGTYVYHCVVTNTEAGHPATSLASDEATITISEDPAAIKLLNGSTVNHTNFITGVTADETVEFMGNTVNYAKFSGTVGGVNGVKDLTRVIAYNATTTQTKIKVSVHNNSTNARSCYVKGLVEGADAAVDLATISLTNKEDKISDWITFDNAANRTIYIFVSSDAGDVYFTQVKVIESGTDLKMAGEAGYSLNFDHGRFFGVKDATAHFEGQDVEVRGSDFQPLNSSVVKLANSSIIFDVTAPVTLTVTTNNNKTYYVTKGSAGTDNETAKTGATEFSLTSGTWYITGGSSNVEIKSIAFALPKCEQPTITTQPATKLTFDPGDLTATVVAAEPTDGGTLSYQWFNASDDSEVIGQTAATLTTTTEGTYYVIVTNTLADHSDNSVKSDEATLAYRDASDATLSALTVSEGTLDPAFDPAEENYTVNLAKGTTTVPTLSATATMHPYATVVINDAAEFVNYEATSTVVVTSEDGTATKTYTVHYVVAHPVAALVDVTENTTWDWTTITARADGSAIDVPSGSKVYGPSVTTEDGLVLANYVLGGDKWDKIEGNNGAYAIRSSTMQYYQGASLHIHTTKSGFLTIKGRNDGSNMTLKVQNAGRDIELGALPKDNFQDFIVFVEAGDVVMYNVPATAGKPMRVSKIIFTVDETPDYSRTEMLGEGVLGTICLPNNVPAGAAFGATFYELQGRDYSNYGKLAFDEIVSGELEAGKPYVFLAHGDVINIYYGATHVDAPVNGNGMYGTFTAITLPNVDLGVENLNDIYYFAQRALWSCDGALDLTIAANRAYVKLSEIDPVSSPSPAPGRRRILLGVNGENQAQGFENLESGDKPLKVMIDGTLYIIRGEKVFDATGRLVK